MAQDGPAEASLALAAACDLCEASRGRWIEANVKRDKVGVVQAAGQSARFNLPAAGRHTNPAPSPLILPYATV